MTSRQPVRATDRLSSSEVDDVLALAAAAGYLDGVYPLSEDVVLRVRGGVSAQGRHLLAYAGDRLAGYAFVEDASGELIVHPQFRRAGVGTELLTAAGPGPLRFWAHGDDPGAAAFAARTGFERARVLWQMRRSLLEPLPDIPLPEGVTVRVFRPGADEQAWLEVNAKAFADHPEQGRWTLPDLLTREDEPWFDPAGFLLAVDVADTVLGFHWTKVHPASGDEPAIGEIYVLGVDPSGHRRGLGAALSVAGLRHLAGAGLTVSSLYVDESNTAAVKLYRRLGFEVYKTDVNYRR
ncbi:mycothiol synthase [Actinoplanes campanulatus]|uniref:Mycothiol acetyltransferase n=1 Tax=Actinoplanes campanulatus TaxID=113559 RepID=A0A7W5AJ32_9ACTN|nr:mycothiol synthase [Actinoplanes campanulatus]MBB3096996.1 mycothiol synthase [Actinoplanes campanulatus]GGN14959.1 mycothiol acetyltransferase [Actinoplanes campanulatus]GID37821.1 mycothiol acetyltransferase [Actinoplanes campanulatus]